MPLLIPEPVDFALTFDLRILQVFTFDHVDCVRAVGYHVSSQLCV
jgi:hypothetical protein